MTLSKTQSSLSSLSSLSALNRRQSHKIQKSRYSLAYSMALCSLLMSCGNLEPLEHSERFDRLEHTERQKNETSESLLSTSSTTKTRLTIPKRFSQPEIDSLYSNKTEERDGKIFPVSNPPRVVGFLGTEAPTEFQKEWGSVTVGAEFKQYLNTGNAPTAAQLVSFLRATEALSTWKEMRTHDGATVFSATNSTDAAGNRIADKVDGLTPENGKILFGHFAMPITKFQVSMNGIIQILRGEDFAARVIRIHNYKDISVPLFGSVARSNGLNILLETYPYQNGWLMYGAAAVKMERFQEQAQPSFVENLLYGFVEWLNKKVVPN